MEFQFDVDCGITTYARFNALATRPPGFIPVRAHAMCSLSARSRAVVCSPGPAPSRERGESEHLESTACRWISETDSHRGGPSYWVRRCSVQTDRESRESGDERARDRGMSRGVRRPSCSEKVEHESTGQVTRG